MPWEKGRPTMPAHSGKVERYTPREIFVGLDTRFDLDVAAPAKDCPSKDYCDRYHSLQEGTDGLEQTWLNPDGTQAFVWMNPPWTKGAKREWVHRLKQHGHGIALVRGGIDSAWLHDHVPDAMFFIRGRVPYLRADQPEDQQRERVRKGGALGGFEPSMLLAYGERAMWVLADCKLNGFYAEPLKHGWR